MSCDGDNEYILITKKCQQLILFFLIFFLFFYFSLYLFILHEDRFLIFLILFVLFVLFLLFFFVSFIFYIFLFKTVYGSSGTGGIETRGTARGYGEARGGCAAAGYGAER